MNNEWVETRRPRESISPRDSFHQSSIRESAKTTWGLSLTALQSFPVRAPYSDDERNCSVAKERKPRGCWDQKQKINRIIAGLRIKRIKMAMRRHKSGPGQGNRDGDQDGVRVVGWPWGRLVFLGWSGNVSLNRAAKITPTAVCSGGCNTLRSICQSCDESS